MLILGGTGRLYGAFVGAAVYMVLEDHLRNSRPTFWQFGIGLLLVLAVLFARRGLLGLLEDAGRYFARGKSRDRRTALEVQGLNRAFGALPVTRDVNLTLERGARRALIGPNGAGKTTLRQSDHRRRSSRRPAACCSMARTSPRLSQAERARRGLARTFQINQLFRGLTVLENRLHDDRRARWLCQQSLARGRLQARRHRRGARPSGCRCGWSTTRSSWCANCPMAASAWSKSPSRWRRSRACCCSTSRRPACRRRKAISSSTWWRASIPTSPS